MREQEMEDFTVEISNVTINVQFASTDEVRCITEMLANITHHTEKIMSAITDFAAKQSAHNDKVSADLDAITTKINDLNALVATLQNSPGTLTAADQATLDKIEAAGADLANKADALAGVTPPTPPSA